MIVIVEEESGSKTESGDRSGSSLFANRAKHVLDSRHVWL